MNYVFAASLVLCCLSSCENQESQEIKALTAMVNDVGHKLNDLGFELDVSDVAIALKSPKEIAALYRTLSLNSRADIHPRDEFGGYAASGLGDEARLAFYDANSRTLVFKKGALSEITKPYLAHELAHVYQDQKWGLESIWRSYQRDPTREKFNITQYLIEGHAELARMAYEQSQSSNLLDSSNLAVDLGKKIQTECTGCNESDSVDQLPYSLGLRFLGKLYTLGGWSAVEYSLVNLPTSSEQILHPKKYHADAPLNVDLPTMTPDTKAVSIEQLGTMGEAFLYEKLITLGAPKFESFMASSGWDGDVAQSYKHKNHAVLIWRIVFDRDLDAEQFAATVGRYPSAGECIMRGRVVDWVMGHDDTLTAEAIQHVNDHPLELGVANVDGNSTWQQESDSKNEVASYFYTSPQTRVFVGPRK